MAGTKPRVAPRRCSKGRFAKATPDSFPLFLRLPPELRNQIYRFALVSLNIIHLEGACPLLRKTSQLRNEAASIYYSENTFRMEIRAMAGAEMAPFRRLQLRYRKSMRSNFRYGLDDRVNWANLLEWMKAYHDPQIPVVRWYLSSERDRSSNGVIIAQAFEVVSKMKNDRWSKVEGVLEAFHLAIATIEPAWA
ncbi:hypothetical protein LTR91_019939 [Friedmanniomyces endolithicus]|uniref:2EXR domain-containing protein n=1 Tax=Friedmanniomyces endolithicus TaxID=329885 RepID=A0AAN6FM52_9PEZI|nr:hypothetical protein LTS09_009895 [Friedmanniomyces endolithicus]KAK0310483.1 hypothetical protein LTR01_003635 [Friedmanniomyces endolithicus]KAK0320773.1 hypothetical protein LTR82_008091 [Friedmanniomyces endolithicus]KAK0835880.1 hypothetical protein LTR73_000381 [Friedmanniomyces endolithicus]KAK0919144.1 hypothetical protein LTR57_011054 [Friedmanniomyces endolithicus]